MIKKLIALVFSVACFSQFAVAVNNEKNVTVTKEEVAVIVETVKGLQKTGMSGEAIAQAMFGGWNLTEEQKKMYIKYATITAAVIAGLAVEEVVLPWATSKSQWYKDKKWTPEFGYGKKACGWLWGHRPFRTKSVDELKAASAALGKEAKAATEAASGKDKDSPEALKVVALEKKQALLKAEIVYREETEAASAAFKEAKDAADKKLAEAKKTK